MFGSIGATEILLVVALACLVFGPSLVRGAGKKLGENVRESKKAIRDIKAAMSEDEANG